MAGGVHQLSSTIDTTNKIHTSTKEVGKTLSEYVDKYLTPKLKDRLKHLTEGESMSENSKEIKSIINKLYKKVTHKMLSQALKNGSIKKLQHIKFNDLFNAVKVKVFLNFTPKVAESIQKAVDEEFVRSNQGTRVVPMDSSDMLTAQLNDTSEGNKLENRLNAGHLSTTAKLYLADQIQNGTKSEKARATLVLAGYNKKRIQEITQKLNAELQLMKNDSTYTPDKSFFKYIGSKNKKIAGKVRNLATRAGQATLGIVRGREKNNQKQAEQIRSDVEKFVNKYNYLPHLCDQVVDIANRYIENKIGRAYIIPKQSSSLKVNASESKKISSSSLSQAA